MKLKLKENPREWQKFATVMMVLATLLTLVAWKREAIPGAWMGGLCGAWLAVTVAAWVHPRPFRRFYRAGMTLSFRVGQVMSAVILTLFFLFIMTPLGLVLRALGKDLLRLKRAPGETSYWKPARTNNNFDRQF